MANNVSSYISFYEMTPKTEKRFEEVFPLIEADGKTIVFGGYDADGIYKIYDTDPETVDNSYEWWVNNVGAKWLNIEDFTTDCMSITTAWSAPFPFYDKLYEWLSKDSPDLMMWVRYDDEMPNFIGCYGIGPNGYDYDEYVDEKSYQVCFGAEPYGEDDDYNEKWWDILDEWYDDEYKFFLNGYQEWKEEQND